MFIPFNRKKFSERPSANKFSSKKLGENYLGQDPDKNRHDPQHCLRLTLVWNPS
jgi:hypothetical protein